MLLMQNIPRFVHSAPSSSVEVRQPALVSCSAWHPWDSRACVAESKSQVAPKSFNDSFQDYSYCAVAVAATYAERRRNRRGRRRRKNKRSRRSMKTNTMTTTTTQSSALLTGHLSSSC